MKDCIAAGKTVFTEQSLAKARSSRCNEAFDLHVAPLTAAGPDGDGRWECSMYVANMVPQSRGRLTLRDSDPRSNPVIDTGYFTDPGDNDLAVLLDGVALTREITREQPQLAALIGPELDETAGMVTAEDLRRNSLHYFHPVGTCKMGPASDLHVCGGFDRQDPRRRASPRRRRLHYAYRSQSQHQPADAHARRTNCRWAQLTVNGMAWRVFRLRSVKHRGSVDSVGSYTRVTKSAALDKQ